jgi:hypothetical protein
VVIGAGWRLSRLAGAAAALALMAGCEDTPRPHARPAAGPELQHPNGLRIVVPDGYRVTQTTSDGFAVEPTGDRMATRSSIVVMVAWLPTSAAMPLWSRRAVLANRALGYTLRQVEEAVGSGGAEYRLKACETVGTGSVCLWQTRQIEHPAASSFELWDIALGVRFVAPATAK